MISKIPLSNASGAKSGGKSRRQAAPVDLDRLNIGKLAAVMMIGGVGLDVVVETTLVPRFEMTEGENVGVAGCIERVVDMMMIAGMEARSRLCTGMAAAGAVP